MTATGRDQTGSPGLSSLDPRSGSDASDGDPAGDVQEKRREKTMNVPFDFYEEHGCIDARCHTRVTITTGISRVVRFW
jgi:hypothetical protein